MKSEMLQFVEQIMDWHEQKVTRLKAISNAISESKDGVSLILGDDGKRKKLTAEQAKFMSIGIQTALLELGTLPFKVNSEEDSDGDEA